MILAASPSRLGEAALDYVARGYPVFPLHWITDDGVCSCQEDECASPGKHPLTTNGFLDASDDAEVVRQWWQGWPSANIGIPTGMSTGLAVLDVDGSLGEQSLARLEDTFGTLPETAESRTGGGGRHLLFAQRQG